jgi:hypothetical protein
LLVHVGNNEYLDPGLLDPKILKAVGSQRVIWTILRPNGQSGKGVDGERVSALNYYSIAK